MDERPAAGAAVLAGVAEHAVDGGRRGLLEIGVRKNDVRGFAAELERNPRDVGSRLLKDADAGQSFPGKGDLVDPSMSGQGAAGAAAGPGDDVEHAFGQAGFERNAAEF